MPYVRIPGTNIVAHVRMAKPRQRRCSAPACYTPATIQCDYHLASGKTCDAWCCRTHATSVGNDLDHCPFHSGHQAGLFTGLLP
jgi:hypothetical protein